MFPEVWELTAAYCRPNRLFSVMDYAGSYVRLPGVDDETADNRLSVVCDPETSGGILAAIPPENTELFEREFEARSGRAPSRIGTVVEGETGMVTVL